MKVVKINSIDSPYTVPADVREVFCDTDGGDIEVCLTNLQRVINVGDGQVTVKVAQKEYVLLGGQILY